ncbi:hypothetical protein [Hymenobacter armeniacus]|uniref:Lipoprotein n=1 Tax=Hymenobacter armeniacus TaxID=2771358 RepID=A0ABR8JNF2_9BACT|nr:hypothetical protein [Hymenobacter armeniacus]MBD2721515.1 hypothetical protein [Hymenobacter armeniacus]
MKKAYLLPTLLGACLWLASCSSNTSNTETETTTSAPAAAPGDTARDKLAARPGPNVQAVTLPNPGIPGFTFPEDSSVINGWIRNRDAAQISRHGWGIWTALSLPTPQRLNGDTLRVYETWPTKDEVDAAQQAAPKANLRALLLQRPTPRRRLNRPRQLFRDPDFRKGLKARAKVASAHAMTADSQEDVFESVSYDPVAASFIVQNKLFWASTLQGLIDKGQGDIPQLPREAIAIKPVYEVVPGGKRGRGLYQMKVWTGTTSARIPFGQEKWSSCVYVDTANGGKGQGQVSPGCAPATPATTYNLRDFVHFKLTAAEAAAMNAELDPGTPPVAYAGDYAILVAMHITTKEIKRWTWQTMWWAPNPDRAPLPSTPGVVAQRPAQLVGAPRHYAMAISYQMIDPVQPFAGGQSVGQSIYVFNPYLEAGFGPGTFSNSAHLREPSRVVTNGLVVVNDVGVRTNCMSCHAEASFTPFAAITSKKMLPLGYLGDTYVDMGSPKFKGRLRTDFLWSIADMASAPPDSLK